jgi:hypothetical protein
MQGVFVKVDAGSSSGSISVNNDDRTHSTGTFLKTQSEIPDYLKLVVSGNGYSDPLFIHEFDQENDGYKMYSMNPNVPQIFVQNNDEEFCMYNISEPSYTCVPFGFWCAISGNYSLSIAHNDFSSYTLMIEDLQEGTLTPISDDAPFTFDYEAGSSKDRFCLHFMDMLNIADENVQAAVVFGQNMQIHVKTFGEPAQIEVFDINGRLISHTQTSGQESAIQVNSAGLYIVKLKQAANTEVRKVVIN